MGDSRTKISLAEYLNTRAWRLLDEESRQQVFDIAAVFKSFYLTGFYSDKNRCWLLDGFPAHPERDDAREMACFMSKEFSGETRTWKVTQSFRGEMEQLDHSHSVPGTPEPPK